MTFHDLDAFVVVDLETTGLSPRTDQIIEIGAIRVDKRTGEHAVFSEFAACETPLSRRITKLTGITDQMLVGAALPRQVTGRLKSFAGTLPLVAYNASFDMGFLKAAAPERTFDSNDVVCALQAARRTLQLPNHKLATVAEHLGVEQKSAHRALDDCLTTLTVFLKICEISRTRTAERRRRPA
jgi:DNA polymerase III epsilon subunit family exonuclease